MLMLNKQKFYFNKLKKFHIISICLFSFVLVCFNISIAKSAEFNIFTLPEILDTEQCLQYECHPFSCQCCKKFICIPGDKVCHYVPRAFIETPKESFVSLVSPFDEMIQLLQMQSEMQQSGGAEGRGKNENLHFFESHMFVVPTFWYLKSKNPTKRLCYWQEAFSTELNYVSEIDSVNWRAGLIDYLMPEFWGGSIANILQLCPLSEVIPPIQSLTNEICMGTWGVTYPRVGFSSVNSSAVASAIVAWRTTRVVSNSTGRVVLFPKFLSKDIKLQLGYPMFATPNNCFHAGTAQSYWDNKTTLPSGTKGYIWVIWERVCCCKCPATGCIGPD